MTRRCWLIVFMLVLAPCAVRADMVLDGFAANPVTVTDHGSLKIARIATLGMAASSWTLQAALEITQWQHYANLRLGVEGTSSYPSLDQAFNVFWRGDDAIRRVRRDGGNSNGDTWPYFVGTSGPLEAGQYNVWLMYDPVLGFRGILSTASSVVWDTGYQTFVNLTPTSIVIAVNDVGNLGSITYDAANHRISYYSYVGTEGAYTYSQAGNVYGLALVTGTAYNALPLTSYKSTSQSSKLVETDFSVDPDFGVLEVSGDEWELLAANMPVPSSYGGAFLFESDISITTWQHYANWRHGVGSTGYWDRGYITFRMNDYGVRECALTLRRAFDAYLAYGPWSAAIVKDASEALACRESIIYDPVKGVRAVVRSSAAGGRVIYDSGWVSSVAGHPVTLDVTQEFMEVGCPYQSGLGTIVYDPANSRVSFTSYSGAEGSYEYRMDGFVESVALRYGFGSYSDLPITAPGAWKGLSDGALARFGSSEITRDVGDSFFVESPDRTTGIRVGKLGTESYFTGSTATINGTIATDSNGEKRIIPSQINAVPGAVTIDPFAMTTKALGGGPGGQQIGVTGGSGLNNVGLLIKAYGKPELTGSSNSFKLDDGSGVKATVMLPAGQTHPWNSGNLPAYLCVVGASGLVKVGGLYNPAVYIGSFLSDVQIISP